MKRTDKYFFYINAEGAPRIIDAAVIDSKGELRGLYCGETLSELAETYEEPNVCTDAEFDAMQEAHWCKPPTECSAERYDNLLNCLPPLHWRTCGGVESFKMREFTVGNITLILARYNGKFYEMHGNASMTADEIAKKIKAVAKQ